MRVSAIRRALVLTLTSIAGVPGVALACPVCFGASDSPMAEGMNAGIFVLLGVTAAVLSAIALVGLRVARQSRDCDAPASAPEVGTPLPLSGADA